MRSVLSILPANPWLPRGCKNKQWPRAQWTHVVRATVIWHCHLEPPGRESTDMDVNKNGYRTKTTGGSHRKLPGKATASFQFTNHNAGKAALLWSLNSNITIVFFKIFLLHVFIYLFWVYTHRLVHAIPHVEVRGQLSGARSFIPLSGSWEFNSDCQTWLQASGSPEPSPRSQDVMLLVNYIPICYYQSFHWFTLSTR